MLTTGLDQALAQFIAAYHARPELVAEQRGWSRTIVLAASDSGEMVTMRLTDGRIDDWYAGGATAADVVVTASMDTLCDILALRRGPNEPYLFGELTVRGAEADFFRLDYITTQLCPS